MAAAANQVRAAHHHLDAMGAAGGGSFERGGKLSEVDTVGGTCRYLICGRVVVAGKDSAEAAGLGHDSRLMGIAQPVADVHLGGYVVHPIGFRQTVLPSIVVLQLGNVPELTLAGGVVHQTDDADLVFRPELGQFLHQRLGTDLGAQVQKMADLQGPLATKIKDFVRQCPRIFAAAGLAQNK